jgi:hypothetical protein
VDRVAKNDWAMKFPFENRQECKGVNARGLAHQPTCDCQTEETVGDGPTERAFPCCGVVNVKWIEITRDARKQHDIAFGNRSSWAFPLISDREVVERAN